VSDRVRSEAELIERYLRPLSAGFAGAFDLNDDCAVLAVPEGQELVVSMDAVAAGVHFFADDDPADIGWKALAVNVSDLAAKGARPVAYVMSLAFPEPPEHAWLESFAAGLAEAQSAFTMALAGGDTDRRPGPLSITITAMGTVPAGRHILRADAHAGDLLFVSGTIGDAALGLELRRDPGQSARWGITPADEAALLQAYLRPRPRLGLRDALLRYASASMDISDGLMLDLQRLCRASGLGAAVPVASLPLSSAARTVVGGTAEGWSRIVTGGDDYEILSVVPSSLAPDFVAAAAAADVLVSEIGVLDDSQGVLIALPDGAPLRPSTAGWEHFSCQV
jgi:thiamine-monophosphate kinase